MSKKRDYYNTPTSDSDVRSQRFKKKRRPPRKETIRLMAKMSYEGGRGRCHFCRESFSMTYLMQVKNPKVFGEPVLACRDCKKELGLIKV